jgi:hypothetical protein
VNETLSCNFELFLRKVKKRNQVQRPHCKKLQNRKTTAADYMNDDAADIGLVELLR